jgi:hypothetical protein
VPEEINWQIRLIDGTNALQNFRSSDIIIYDHTEIRIRYVDI